MDRAMYCVRYRGRFGFIKPWCSVRDSITYSQRFLTESIISGIEMKIFPELRDYSGGYKISRIIRHRIRCKGIDLQQEVIESKVGKNGYRKKSIVKRGVLINPEVVLCFVDRESAERAIGEHIYLCRNEDILYPFGEIEVVRESEFDSDAQKWHGWELLLGEGENSFQVGFNRYRSGEKMYGSLYIVE